MAGDESFLTEKAAQDLADARAAILKGKDDGASSN
jgi:hypothetical protein